ncbi:hypothetical protein [Bacillus sp. B-jedd]|uniref:hypothetical protein n=1 Tax=Bacillus sp. B-jedd TaxID=1476857 RepID=UPI0005156939|nr:hypothetical protein [Bacillus sp. B-jedd]CEG25472.1 hypothetical protein BN1002_00283 [Bacillus sp. B-jedd]
MKFLRQICTSVFAVACVLSFGFGIVSAAEPLDANISPAIVSYLKTTSKEVTKTLSWGGGAGAIYNVSYNDGLTNRTFSANYYSAPHKVTYTLGTYSTYKWNNYLRVSNGTLIGTASGSVTLSR